MLGDSVVRRKHARLAPGSGKASNLVKIPGETFWATFRARFGRSRRGLNRVRPEFDQTRHIFELSEHGHVSALCVHSLVLSRSAADTNSAPLRGRVGQALPPCGTESRTEGYLPRPCMPSDCSGTLERRFPLEHRRLKQLGASLAGLGPMLPKGSSDLGRLRPDLARCRPGLRSKCVSFRSKLGRSLPNAGGFSDRRAWGVMDQSWSEADQCARQDSRPKVATTVFLGATQNDRRATSHAPVARLGRVASQEDVMAAMSEA